MAYSQILVVQTLEIEKYRKLAKRRLPSKT